MSTIVLLLTSLGIMYMILLEASNRNKIIPGDKNYLTPKENLPNEF